MELTRNDVMNHVFQGENVALIFMRQVALDYKLQSLWRYKKCCQITEPVRSNKGTMSSMAHYIFIPTPIRTIRSLTMISTSTLRCVVLIFRLAFIKDLSNKLKMGFIS